MRRWFSLLAAAIAIACVGRPAVAQIVFLKCRPYSASIDVRAAARVDGLLRADSGAAAEVCESYRGVFISLRSGVRRRGALCTYDRFVLDLTGLKQADRSVGRFKAMAEAGPCPSHKSGGWVSASDLSDAEFAALAGLWADVVAGRVPHRWRDSFADVRRGQWIAASRHGDGRGRFRQGVFDMTVSTALAEGVHIVVRLDRSGARIAAMSRYIN